MMHKTDTIVGWMKYNNKIETNYNNSCNKNKSLLFGN